MDTRILDLSAAMLHRQMSMRGSSGSEFVVGERCCGGFAMPQYPGMRSCRNAPYSDPFLLVSPHDTPSNRTTICIYIVVMYSVRL